MRRLGTALVIIAAWVAPVCAGVPHYIDLSPAFPTIAYDTADMAEAPRVAEVRRRLNLLFPGFYEPRNGVDPARYDARVSRALNSFAALSPTYKQAQQDFPAAYAAGIKHFRKVFPGFEPNIPVYFLHSLGEMDGGTREIRGKVYLIFGADVIARMHKSNNIGPFLDHELFHVEHAKYFTPCDAVWCALWIEGLATYAAKTMNPQADDEQLLLTSPQPIRAAVDAHWLSALCFAKDKMFSSAVVDFEAFFVGGGGETRRFPDRVGYYLGLRAMQELGGQYSLRKLARMRPEAAKAALTTSLNALIARAGNCR